MLSGRDVELAEATARVAERGVAILGPAGVGKTALAREVMSRLDQRRTHLAWVSATDASRQVPFGALAALVPESTAPDATVVLPAIRATLRRRADGRRLVVAVDDAHLLDGPSAGVLLGLVPHARLVVTARSGGSCPDAVTALWKDGHLDRLDLVPFDRAGAAALVRGLVGGEVAAPTVDLLLQWTRGNALFLTELVRTAVDDGTLVQESGLWWWRAPLRVPPALTELLDRRLHDLPAPERDALAAVALGEPLPLDILERLVPADVVVGLEDRGLLHVGENGDSTDQTVGLAVSFRHPLLGAAARRRLSAARRRRAAAMLLEAHPDAPAHPLDRVMRARWQLDARGSVDAELLLDAADLVAHVDPALARRLSGEALRRRPSTRASVTHAQALVEDGDPAAARATLERAADQASTPAEHVLVAVALAGHRAWPERDPAGGHTDLAALLSEVPDPAARADIRSLDALVQLFGGRAPLALDAAELVLQDPASDRPAALRARLTQAAALTLVGRTREALAVGERAAADAASDAAGLPYAQGMASAAIGLAQLWRAPVSQLPTTHPATGRWPIPADRLHGALEPVTWPLFEGYVRRVAGDLDGAIARLREALVQQSGGEGLFRSEAAAWLVISLAEAGRVAEAVDVLGSTPPDAVALVPGLLPWASAAVARARGDHDEAVRQVTAAVDAARRSGCRLVELGYLLYEAEIRGSAVEVSPRIRQIVDAVDAPRLVVSAEATLAVADARAGDEGTLLRHVDALEEMGLLRLALVAAEAAEAVESAEAAELPAGGPSRARADELRSTLGIGSATTRPELTAREAQVAALAAEGLSDRDIAETLVVSVRTVESHLSRVYRKLHVSSRRRLRGALDEVDRAVPPDHGGPPASASAAQRTRA
ncbi:MAG: LuxR C-terminal-related transcriptional regulator [Phycicoccus sp.]